MSPLGFTSTLSGDAIRRLLQNDGLGENRRKTSLLQSGLILEH